MVKRTSNIEPLFDKVLKAHIVISLNHNNSLEIIKNRYDGITGPNVPIKEAIKIFSKILSILIFKNERHMFQEGMRIRLIKQLSKTMEKEINIEGGDNHYDTL